MYSKGGRQCRMYSISDGRSVEDRFNNISNACVVNA